MSSTFGSVSTRASKYSRPDGGRDFSGGFQQAQNRCCVTKEVESAVVGGDLLMGAGAGTEEVTQLVVGPAEAASRSRALESTHRTAAAFDTAMILLQPVVKIAAVAVPHTLAQRRPDRPWCRQSIL
jgi:hypothetical protein